MPKLKLCKWKDEPCEDERINYPGKSILSPYCKLHLALSHIYKKRLQDIKTKNVEKRIQSKEKKENKINLLSVDGYRSRHVQPIINEIARLIDYGQPCIATGNHSGKMSGGHFFAVGSNRTICLNLHNIHIQSFHSNSAMGGDNIRYRDGIIKIYGIYYMEKIEALKSLKPIKLTKEDLIEIKKIATEIRNKLKNNLTVYPPEKRIELRESINQKIGIYI